MKLSRLVNKKRNLQIFFKNFTFVANICKVELTISLFSCIMDLLIVKVVVFMNLRTNQSGFTLIELLAVIVILAFIILFATNSVLSQVDKGRKMILVSEGEVLINSAKNAYQTAILEGSITTGAACFSLEYLYDAGLYSKGKNDKYTGSVLVKPEGNQVSYTFWISNGSHVATADSGAGTKGSAITDGASASENCSNVAGAKLFSK